MKGGLGTACFGMTQALTKQGVEVIFVLPRYSGPAMSMDSRLQLMSASGVSIPEHLVTEYHRRIRELWQGRLSVRPIESLLYPYATQEDYTAYLRSIYKRQSELLREDTYTPPSRYDLSGDYGQDLMSEVFRYSNAVGSLALQERFDVVHAHDWMAFPAGMMVKYVTGKPFIAHAHALEYDRSGYNINPEVAGIERAGFEAADMIVAVSHLTRNLIMQEYGISGDKIAVVHNAVSRRDSGVYVKYAKEFTEKRVLFMGRVTFQKGPDYFIEAANLVLGLMPDVRFIMAGNGDMLTRMVRRAAQLRIGRRIHFTGFLHGSDVDRMYALSDLYVMPSVSEPFGIAPLEAMLYDVPVLISKQSGVSEVVRNALKVDFWDVREMANKICAILRYPSLAKEMVKNCREELKNIKWDNAAAQLRAIYAATCSRSKYSQLE
jgi:glycosyltransferase involved in cell wall biosynthesis